MKRLYIFFFLVLMPGIFCLTAVKAGENLIPESISGGIGPMAEIAQLTPPIGGTSPPGQEGAPGNSYSKADWLKRTTIGAILESDQKPRYYIETVQPFYQSAGKKHTVFTHIRISGQDDYGTYSAGVGYRRLLFNNSLMAWINTFFDYQDPHQHYRQGVGLEAIGTSAELRANGYFGLSPARKVAEPGTYEKARDGFDVELGVPVPYLPWMKVFGSLYWYDFKEGPDVEGWKGRAQLKPLDFLTINLETYDDNKGSQEWRSDVRLTLWVDSFAPKDILAALTSSFRETLPEVDMKERTLDRVERNFQITVEKWSDGGGTGGFSVQVGRT
ncbi:MAG: inverse autotransporter beta domain-containing protein [Deltaproteobacteria bacterium]|nr:inverse autotransporter beta domain-containing protein [Deltaproteobacteria bacterium]